MSPSLTKRSFTKKARNCHGDRYDYRLVRYKNNTTPVKIICKIHGIFTQTPAIHLDRGNCQKCSYKTRADKLRKTPEMFIQQARAIHGDKYNYDHINYVGS